MSLEHEYWSFVEEQLGDPVSVEYAADLDVIDVGSGFGRTKQKVIDAR